MRIAESVIVAAAPAAVWGRISDPTRWPRDLGRLRCSHVGATPEAGVGARYWLHLEVGAAEVGSLIEILEYEPESALTWTTIRGFEQRGHWRLRKRDAGVELTLGVSYQASGGLAALVTDELSSFFVGRYLRDALSTLARRLETVDTDRPTPARTARIARGAQALGGGARLAGDLARVGLTRPVRPDRYLRSLTALARSGPATAGRYGAVAALHPDAPAVVDDRGTLTFSQLQQRASLLANALADGGIGAGTTVALMCRNHSGFLEALLATSMLGADRLLLDTQLAETALAELLGRERPLAMVYDAEFTGQLNADRFNGKAFVAWADPNHNPRHRTLDELIAAGPSGRHVPPVGYEGLTTTFAPHTGETLEGVSHRSPPAGAALSILDAIPLRPGESMLVAAPLSDRWGLMFPSISSLLASALVFGRALDAEATLASIERERVSTCVLDTAALEGILALAPSVRRSYDTSALHNVLVGGPPLSPALTRRFVDAYGEILYAVYVTNTAGWVTIAGPKDLCRAPGTAGRPPRDGVVRVLDEDGVSLLPGQTGRIFVANQMLCDRRDAEHLETFDGLVATGEIGRLDDHGRLFVDRSDGG